MKTIIFIVAGLLVGVAGGTFVGGTKEKEVILERMATEKAAADALEAQQHTEDPPPSDGAEVIDHGEPGSEAGSETSTDGGEVVEAGQEEGSSEDDGNDPPPEPETSDPEPAVGDDGQTTVEDPSVPEYNPAPLAPTVTPSATGAPQATSPLLAKGPERLAKIFGAMDPEDAAAVLQKLTDGEIRPILLNMSDRKVAAILENFLPERAASLSRLVLGDRSGND